MWSKKVRWLSGMACIRYTVCGGSRCCVRIYPCPGFGAHAHVRSGCTACKCHQSSLGDTMKGRKLAMLRSSTLK
ncbi:hypothetical protein L227DRAFT_264540 [Lentinus tigrinus ALCF2SS1-6]|uniref:Uncharacterized protein n=1 Tax=Lentinus tigrinus ALCF2SS1-6 TaxID=1328759 RepID=A0A5C2SNI8_9APHY|nr:hypothetical protein L227DRAFT_264540 [Lentinus tigrinus ALCF2SS1-6]